MPAPRLHGTLIGGRIVELIDQGLSAELGLKVVSLGALEFYPALENLASIVPAVFVKPAPSTTLERITTGQTYRMTYGFRIVHVRLFGPNEEIIKSKIVDAEKIAELLVDNIDLGGLVLPNGQIHSSIAKVIEWEPAEDNLVATIHADMTAAALTFMVETTSRK